MVADALSRFAYPASKAFQDTSFHGSEAARQEMKKIIEEELQEGRTLGLIATLPQDGTKRKLFIAGTISKRLKEKIPQSHIFDVTTHGAISNLNPHAEPFVPLQFCQPDIFVVQTRGRIQPQARTAQNEASSSSNLPPISAPQQPPPPTNLPLLANRSALSSPIGPES